MHDIYMAGSEAIEQRHVECAKTDDVSRDEFFPAFGHIDNRVVVASSHDLHSLIQRDQLFRVSNVLRAEGDQCPSPDPPVLAFDRLACPVFFFFFSSI